MPIIIDNFHVNTNAPIDNRFVVGGIDSFYQDKNDIEYKYLGLRIWDLNDNIPYCWKGDIDGWVSENSIGVLADTNSILAGAPNYISKFTTGPTVLGRSIIYENPATNQIGIGLTGSNIQANVSLTSEPYSLHVLGNIKTNKNLIGKGLYISDINASNINSGLLDIRHISHLQGSNNISLTLSAGVQYVLSNSVARGSVIWKDAGTLSVALSNTTNNINVTSTDSSDIHYITFVQNIGSIIPIKINSSKIQFKPSNGQFFLNNGSLTEPVYSFLNSVNTGIYYNGDINFTKQGNNYLSIIDNGIAIKSTLYPQIQFIETTNGKNRLLWVDNNDTLLFRLDTNNGVTDKRVWHQDNLYTLKSIQNNSLVPEISRNTHSQSFDANGAIVQGVYTYNVRNSTIGTSLQTFWSVVSFGKGTDGSVQLASNWYGNNSVNGIVYADRDILLRSLRDTGDDWSPWVKIWNSGNSGYVPFGAIMMWSGTILQIPTGWRLCNGGAAVSIPAGSVPGQPGMISIAIPDLRDKFIIGANTGTTTNITGSSTQTGGTKDAIVVSHTHTLRSGNHGAGKYGNVVYYGAGSQQGGSLGGGGGDVWSDTFSADVTGTSGTDQNLPPYYALAFIIYTGVGI